MIAEYDADAHALKNTHEVIAAPDGVDITKVRVAIVGNGIFVTWEELRFDGSIGPAIAARFLNNGLTPNGDSFRVRDDAFLGAVAPGLNDTAPVALAWRGWSADTGYLRFGFLTFSLRSWRSKVGA